MKENLVTAGLLTAIYLMGVAILAARPDLAAVIKPNPDAPRGATIGWYRRNDPATMLARARRPIPTRADGQPSSTAGAGDLEGATVGKPSRPPVCSHPGCPTPAVDLCQWHQELEREWRFQ